MDLYELGHTQIVDRGLSFIKTRLNALKVRVLLFTQALKYDDKGVVWESYKKVEGQVETFLNSQKGGIYSELENRIRSGLKVEAEKMARSLGLSNAVRDRIIDETMEHLAEDYKGKTAQDRVNVAVDRVIEDLKKDMLHRDKDNLKEVIGLRFSDKLSMGVSLYVWLSKLYIGEFTRLSQQMELSMYEENDVKKFRWRLSDMHEILWKKYKNRPHPEICEVRAKKLSYTVEELRDLFPAHPHCTCYIEPLVKEVKEVPLEKVVEKQRATLELLKEIVKTKVKTKEVRVERKEVYKEVKKTREEKRAAKDALYRQWMYGQPLDIIPLTKMEAVKQFREKNLARARELVQLNKILDAQRKLKQMNERLKKAQEELKALKEKQEQLDRVRIARELLPRRPMKIKKTPLTAIQKQAIEERIRTAKWMGH